MQFQIYLIFILSITFPSKIEGIMNSKTTIYLIPGQGADHRIFNNFELDLKYNIKHIKWKVPTPKETLSEYAQRLAYQIDTSGKYILIGISLGGMVATEMAEFLKPEKVIIISSAKNRGELPGRYKFMSVLPINRIVPASLLKAGTFIAQPLVEPDRKNEKETFVAMIKAINPQFLKRTIDMIINWERLDNNKDIIHIHGTKDQTLPIKNIRYDYKIDGGSHMMALTRGKEVSQIINSILGES